MSSKTYIRHNNVMNAKGLGGGGRKRNRTHPRETWWSFFTEPGYLQFSLKDSLCVCKSVIYHSFVALFHLGKKKVWQAIFFFLYLKVALKNNKVLLNHRCVHTLLYWSLREQAGFCASRAGSRNKLLLVPCFPSEETQSFTTVTPSKGLA